MSLRIRGDLLLVGEGDRDTVFFTELCRVNEITGFQFEHAKGIHRFPEFFAGYPGWTGFDSLRALTVVADNDADAGKAFELVQRSLRGAGLPAPNRPLEWVKRDDTPKVTILQMPFDGGCSKLGCLETLVLGAMRDAYPDAARCADQLAACTQADKWTTQSSRDKFILRSVFSSIWEDNPNCGIAQCLQTGLVPLDHAVFQPLIELLKHLPRWLGSDNRSWGNWKEQNLGRVIRTPDSHMGE
jgi:hypothetical protein